MAKDKQIIVDIDIEWTSTDSDESSSDDEELVSTNVRGLNMNSIKVERVVRRATIKTERNRTTTTLGSEVLSIPSIARLTRPHHRLSVESFLRTSNPRSVLMEEDLSDIRGQYGFPNEVQLRLPFPDERADTVLEGWICMYTIYFECGL